MSFQSSKVRLVLGLPLRVLAVVGAAVLAFGTFVGVSGDLNVLTSFGLIFSYALAFAVIALRGRQRRGATGELRVGEGDLRLLWNERLLSHRHDIIEGLLIPPDGGPPEVLLARRFPRASIALQVPDDATGRELLAALGLDASQTVASFKIASLLRVRRYATVVNVLCAILAIVSLIALSSGAAENIALGSVLAALVAAWTTFSVVGGRARVGADGVLLTWLWEKHFYGFDDLQGVRMFIDSGNAGIGLELTDGREVRIPMMGLFQAEMPRDKLTRVVARVQQAAEVHRRAQGDRGVLLPLRAQRSATEWLRALRAMGSGANLDHRTAPVETDTLLRIAEDPGGEPQRRVAAAVALGGALDPSARERLRIAASATAAPSLRAALELAADEAASEEALASALDGLDDAGESTLHASA